MNCFIKSFIRRRGFGAIVFFILSAHVASADNAVKTLPDLLASISPAIVALADEQHSLASGFFVTPNTLLTSYHVKPQGRLYLLHVDGKKNALKRVASNAEQDLALYRATRYSSPQVLNISAALPPVGTEVIAVGNPFGLGISASRGIISALPHVRQSLPRLQTDAAVNAGNSGGPLIDRSGQVVGLVSSRGAVGTGIGFAVPAATINAFLQHVESLKR